MKYASHPLTLRQLQYVVAVAEEKNFRRAAERCHVSQPSLSAQIGQVEQALSVRLFERGRRGVLVTRAGVELVARARDILLSVDDLVETAKRHIDPLAGVLRVGVISTIGPYLLPDLDPALRAAFPGLLLRWTEDKTEALVRRVLAGELDAALLAREADIDDLACESIGEDPFVLAAPAGHKLASGKRPVRLNDLRGEDVLLLDDGHCLRDQALDLCAAAGAKELGFRATSLTTLVQMVAAGPSVTLLPRIAAPIENRRGLLSIRPFARPAPKRTLVFAWRRRSPISGPMKRLAGAARIAFESASGNAGK
ncbi:LysR family transcriptional regulator [bacterium]|nr:LysR family transcriptional regulator [bacterium]